MKEDPVYVDQMFKTSMAETGLHNYYQEFRLGQGDPLLKASMKQWPNTTTCDTIEGKQKDGKAKPCKSLSRKLKMGSNSLFLQTDNDQHHKVPYDPNSDYCEYAAEDAC